MVTRNPFLLPFKFQYMALEQQRRKTLRNCITIYQLQLLRIAYTIIAVSAPGNTDFSVLFVDSKGINRHCMGICIKYLHTLYCRY